MKKIVSLLLTLVLTTSLLAGCASSASTDTTAAATTAAGETTAAAGDTFKVACLVYKYDDVYLSTVRAAIEKYAKDAGNIQLDMYDGQGDQGKQLDQLDAILSGGVDLIMVNMCDQSSAQTIINLVKDKNIPLVFYNREPTDITVLSSYDKCIFVGTQAKDAGVMQGQLLAKLWNADPSYDRNKDGKVQYVVFKGEADNLEAIARTEFCQSAATDAGLKMEAVADVQVCNWTAELAKNAMDAIMSSNPNLEAVLCNNDDMATGVISSLNDYGYNTGSGDKNIIVLGVDATDAAKSAIADGKMQGTIKQDGDAMAKAMVDISENFLQGKDKLDGLDYKLDDTGVAIRIPYSTFTSES